MITSRIAMTVMGYTNDAMWMCEFEDGLVTCSTENPPIVNVADCTIDHYLKLLTFGGMTTVHKLRETLDTYHMIRNDDISGNSGTGHVADVVVFPNGKAVVRWRKENSLGIISTVVYNSLEDAITVHGHGGKTTFKKVS